MLKIITLDNYHEIMTMKECSELVEIDFPMSVDDYVLYVSKDNSEFNFMSVTNRTIKTINDKDYQLLTLRKAYVVDSKDKLYVHCR